MKSQVGWRAWEYHMVESKLKGYVYKILRRQQDGGGKTVRGKWHAKVKERPEEKVGVAYAGAV